MVASGAVVNITATINWVYQLIVVVNTRVYLCAHKRVFGEFEYTKEKCFFFGH